MFPTKLELTLKCKSHTTAKSYQRNKQCGNYFTQASRVKHTHIMSHSAESPHSHTCTECGKDFRGSKYLKTHMLIHTGERPHTCNECGVSFTQKQTLQRHMKTHTGERPYRCKICRKCFTQRGTLNAHSLTHTGEKPHTCKLCAKKFTKSSSLHNHMRIHSGERPHACSECAQSFIQKVQLTNHMRTHTGEQPYRCKECGKRFAQLAYLKVHMVKHSGERPYICDECGKSFLLKCNLQTHMRTQTGERPYSCTQCDKYFTQAGSLRRHMRSFCIKKDKNSTEKFLKHDTNECEVKPFNLKNQYNISGMDNTQGIVIKVEADVLNNSKETTSDNNVNQLNMNIMKVEAIVDRPSEMEHKPLIPLKGEVNNAPSVEEKTPHFKVEGAKEEISFMEELNTYL